MARRKGIVHSLVQAQREAERQRLAQMRLQAQFQTLAARTAMQAQKAHNTALIADQKERDRLAAEAQIAQVNFQNEQLSQSVKRLENLLLEALPADSFINLQTLKQPPNLPQFNPGSLGVAQPPPAPHMYRPPDLTGLQRLVPGAKEKYAQEVALCA